MVVSILVSAWAFMLSGLMVVAVHQKKGKEFVPAKLMDACNGVGAMANFLIIESCMKPDIIRLNFTLSGHYSYQSIASFRSSVPEAKIIVHTRSNRKADVLKAVQMGASGYLLKPASINKMSQCIHAVARRETWLNERVAPFILAAVKHTHDTSEAVTLEQNDQFMFGPSILVAPYCQNHLQKRQVKLPKGNWYDFYTGDFVGNGTTVEVSTPERTPLFVKDGAVIPMLTKGIVNSREAYGHPMEVRHYGRQPGFFELYEDDGKTFGFERGEYALRKLEFKDGQGKESVIRKGNRLFDYVENQSNMTKQDFQ